MSKAVMLSIRPKWCEKIASGEKTIEVRKTKPKLDTPFRGYIYCTLQGCNEFFRVDLGRDVAKWNRGKWADRKGNVIGEFICDRIYELAPLNHAPDDVEKQACMTREEIVNYLKGTGYGWHISDLRIYDQPREFTEFRQSCPNDHTVKTAPCTATTTVSATMGLCRFAARPRAGAMWRRIDYA